MTSDYNTVSKEGIHIMKITNLIRCIVADIKEGKDKSYISYKFHLSLANAIKDLLIIIRKENSLNKVCLSGGCFQNVLLTETLCKLLEKEKIGISCAAEDWIKEALDIPKLRLVQLTPRISYQSTVLPGTFHQDPADQIIVATAREENGVILTKDRLISQYPHVKTTW